MKKIVMISVVLFMNFVSISQALTMDYVTVGNAGNAGEQSRSAYGDTTYYGAVGYEYQIGKYEVTAGQYTELLNAVADTDTYNLYNANMWESSYGCKIQREGNSGSYTYSVAADYTNRPVNYVSWGDSARFTNWMHNGQPTGIQDVSTTEDGSYTMVVDLQTIIRNVDATWVIPTEDEWYKAAYHKNDGVTGNYFDYPTGSSNFPSNYLVDPDPGNNATLYATGHASTIGPPYFRTEVGAHENSDSPYGTFDMCGNVWEWNEVILYGAGSYRGVRGSSFLGWGEHSESSWRHAMGSPSFEHYEFGFRVASVPEPTTLSLLAIGAVLLRRRRTYTCK